MRTDRLLERDREREELRSVVDGAPQHAGAAALVSGPAGIGKTRLLDAAAAIAEASGVGVLRARGGEMEREFPYGVVRQLLEREAGRAGAGELRGAARLAAPALGLADTGEATGDPAGREFALCHGLYWLISDLAEQRPRLLIVDDLQDVDAPSLRFLLYLVRRIQGLPLALVASLRDGGGPTDPGALAELVADPATRAIRPRALHARTVAELVCDRLGERPHDAFVEACLEVTGGNPFLIGQLLAAAASEHLDPGRAGAARVRELVPEAVKLATLNRLGREPEPVAALARAVAVLGDDVELRYAAELAELDAATAAGAAERLAQMRLLREGPSLSFLHPLLRSTVLAGMRTSERAAAHERAARVLEAAAAPAAAVAAHLTALEPAGDERTVAVLRAAAAAALEQGAADIATRHLRRALDEPPGAAERGAVLEELGCAASLAGEAAAAAAALDESVALATDPRERLVRELRAFRAHFQADGRLDPDDIIGMIERVDTLGDTPDRLTLGLVGDLFGAATNLPDLLPELGARLDRHATSRGDAVTARMRLAVLARAANHRGESAQRAADYAERAMAERRADETVDSVSWFTALFTLIDADRLETVDRHLAAALELSRRLGSKPTYASVSGYEALVAYQRGDVGRAEAMAVAAIDTGALHGALMPLLIGCLVRARLAAGDVDGAAAAIAPLGEGDIPDLVVFNHALVARAQVRFAQGRLDAALEDVRLSLSRLPRAVGYTRVLPWRQIAVQVLRAAGLREEAVAVAADDVAAAERWRTPAAIGSALACQASCVGPWERLPLLEQAIPALEHSPARLDLAVARLLLGETLTELGSPDDAREPLAAGLALAEECGAGALVTRGRAALAATGARSQPTAARGPASAELTPGERRVIDLAAEGLSKRDIAEALFVTEKTVQDDLDRLRAKGIAVRAEPAISAPTVVDSPANELLAQVLPHYEIGGQLGRGACGVVWAGRHRRLGRRVAIKQLSTAIGADSHLRARFLAEARVLAWLDHPNVVVVNDFLEVDGTYLLIMERLDGGTAKSRLVEGSLTAPAACAIALATCLGLDYAHGKGVLHRDVKPQNVLLSEEGVVKVADFGIAKVLAGSTGVATRTGLVLGTPAYMAPEQAAGGEVSPAVDVYAAGVVLYELLSGKLPYPPLGNPLADLEQLLSSDPVPLRRRSPDVPAALAAIADRALRRDPAERYATAGELAAALSEAATGEWGADWMSDAADVLRAPLQRVRA